MKQIISEVQIVFGTVFFPSLIQLQVAFVLWFFKENNSFLTTQKNPNCYIYLISVFQIYYLASVRLRDLCERLDVDTELRSLIWTGFENILMHHVDLMQVGKLLV